MGCYFRKHVASKNISFAIKNTFECMIFMFYLMLLRVNQDDTLTLSSVNWFERKIIKYTCQFNVLI